MPIPTAGSSGGPIVDEESGAVVGLIRGSKLDNRHEGLRGWAIPAEAIYEVYIFSHIRAYPDLSLTVACIKLFSLPGLRLVSKAPN